MSSFVGGSAIAVVVTLTVESGQKRKLDPRVRKKTLYLHPSLGGPWSPGQIAVISMH